MSQLTTASEAARAKAAPTVVWQAKRAGWIRQHPQVMLLLPA
jgi:hypothetical protein